MLAPSLVRRLALRAPLFALGLWLTGCGHTVSEHVIDVVVDDEGIITRGVLSFAAHDEEIVGGDGSCGLFSGNCGDFTRAHAAITGDAPIAAATMETHGEGDSRTYDVELRRREDDPVQPMTFWGPNVQCRVYHFTDRTDLSRIGAPNRCYNTTRNINVTLTFRDGDDGS